jgi:1-acyl-sn-glycerol-3-phosphate acyltransferase
MTAEAVGFRRNFLQTLWYWLFRALGWNADYREPDAPKYIIIVWPHTSNWDFPLGFIFSRAWPMPRPHFLAKNSAFKGIMGPIARWAGGIPVDRSKSTNFVDQVAAEFARHERFVLAVTPEGTRSKTAYWKSGFYYMALAANVPVVMATIDYAKKLISYGTSFMPSGNLEADFDIIRRYYAGAQGRHPERMGEIQVRPTEPGELAEPTEPTEKDAPAA